MISELMLNWVTGPLARAGRQRTIWHLPWGMIESTERREARERQHCQEQMRYYVGRGRRARDAGNFGLGAVEARKAVDASPQSAWALALLGQCLTWQPHPDLWGARLALERARTLEPANGYFVRLLLDVLNRQGDVQGRAELLARAWWQGAPVERWLPDGPPRRRAAADSSSDAARSIDSTAPVPDEIGRSREAVLASGRFVGA